MAYASAVALTVQEISRAGKAVSKAMVTPTATHGNKFLNDGRTMLRVKNGSAAPITVTIDCPATLDGQAVTDLTVTINATADANGLDFQDIGPFPASFSQTDGYVWATFSAVTDVTVGAYRLPKV
jgi:hypothetical protein